MFTPEKRTKTADHVLSLLAQDERIAAALTVGSMATEPDRWSDIDLAIAVADHVDHVVVAHDWVGRLYEKLPVLHYFETAFGDSLVRGFSSRISSSLTSPSHPGLSSRCGDRRRSPSTVPVSLALDQAAEAGEPPGSEWSAEAGFAWHDVLHACAAARRGCPWQSLWYLERIRNRTLRLAQQCRGWDADFFDHSDDLPTAELSPLEATLVTKLEPTTLLRAIEIATIAFLTELRRGDPALADRLESPLLDLTRFMQS